MTDFGSMMYFLEKTEKKLNEKLTASCKENEELKKRVEKLEKIILELQSKKLER